MVREVGNGAASTVFQALHRRSNREVALKRYRKSKLSTLNRAQARAACATVIAFYMSCSHWVTMR
jgi:serine/threonine protein kinase